MRPFQALKQASREALRAGRLADAKWIEDRAEAKRAKDFARADDIRKQIEAAGFELRDTPQGTECKRLAPG
jgi:cysteinyl-tRNA synthetase